MIHVNVRERDAAAQATEPITSGSVGLAVSFRFSEDWDGMAKAAIFKGSGTAVDVELLTADSCAVPHEVLQSAGGHLKIGVYGTRNQGQRVTPTVWADAGQIFEGAAPSQVTPTPAAQNLVQQALEAAETAVEAAESAEAIAQGLRDDADNGAFDGEDGASAYEIAVEQGYSGTEAQWLQSLHGQDATVDATLSNAGQAADAAETGKVKAAADRHEAELLALTPELGSDSFTWTLGKYINDAGLTRNGDGMARAARKSVEAGALIQNKSPDSVTINGETKTPGFWVHEYNGTTWIKRTKLAKDEYVVLGSTTDGINICWGFSSAQNVTVTQQMIDDNFGVRIVQKPTGGSGGSITVDDALSDSSENPVQNKVIKAALDAKGTYSKPSGGIPATDLASGVIPTVPSASSAAPQALGTAAAGSSTDYARADHVHAKPGAADIGAVASNQGSGNAGKFLVVGNDGNVAAVTMTAWQGGNY